MTDAPSAPIASSGAPAAYAIALLVVAILMVTLVPFDFHWLGAARFPVLRFTKSDMAQNILLFAPLGFVLARTGLGFGWALAISVALSGLVEFCQLSIPGRSSNFVDILTNGGGGALGWFYARLAFRDAGLATREDLFALITLPLCWVVAMRSLSEPLMALLCVLVVGAGLNGWQAKRLHRLAWLAAALLPLLYAGRAHVKDEGLGWAAAVIVASWALAGLAGLGMEQWRMPRRLQGLVLLAVAMVFAVVDGWWFASIGAHEGWTARTHLHWAGFAGAIALLVYHQLWIARNARASLTS